MANSVQTAIARTPLSDILPSSNGRQSLMPPPPVPLFGAKSQSMKETSSRRRSEFTGSRPDLDKSGSFKGDNVASQQLRSENASLKQEVAKLNTLVASGANNDQSSKDVNRLNGKVSDLENKLREASQKQLSLSKENTDLKRQYDALQQQQQQMEKKAERIQGTAAETLKKDQEILRLKRRLNAVVRGASVPFPEAEDPQLEIIRAENNRLKADIERLKREASEPVGKAPKSLPGVVTTRSDSICQRLTFDDASVLTNSPIVMASSSHSIEIARHQEQLAAAQSQIEELKQQVASLKIVTCSDCGELRKQLQEERSANEALKEMRMLKEEAEAGSSHLAPKNDGTHIQTQTDPTNANRMELELCETRVKLCELRIENEQLEAKVCELVCQVDAHHAANTILQRGIGSPDRQRLEEEIRSLKAELQDALNRVAEFKEENVTHLREKDALREEILRLKEYLSSAESQIEALDKDKTTLEQEFAVVLEAQREELQGKIAVMEAGVGSLATENRTFEEKIVALQRQEGNLRDRVAAVEAEKAFLEEEREVMEYELDSLRSSASGGSTKDQQNALVETTQELTSVQIEKGLLEEAMKSTEEEVLHMKSQMKEMADSLEKKEQLITCLQIEKALVEDCARSLEEEMESLRGEASSRSVTLSEAEQIKADKGVLEKSLEKAREEIKNLDREQKDRLASMNKQIMELKTTVKLLQNSRSVLEVEYEKRNSELASLKSENERLKAIALDAF